MRRRVAAAMFVALVFGLGIHGVAAAQQRYETYTGFIVDTTPELPPNEVHPSLYFDASDIDALRDRIPEEYDAPYGQTWFAYRTMAHGFLGDDAAQEDYNDRPQMAKSLAFWWLMKGDTTALQGAVDALMLAYEGVPQTDQKPYDEIYRATWIQNYAAAYDWVHSELTPEQDAEIRSRLVSEAQFLHENLESFGRPHNHVSKPAWGLGTLALTLSAHPDAADWLQNALEQMNSVTRYQFSADGIYREGGHYWMYNAVNKIPFLWHYLNVSGVDLFPDYQPAFEWPVKTRMGRGYIPNIEDSYLKPAPTHMVAAQYLDAETDLNPESTLGNVLMWNWETTELFTTKYTGATNDVTWDLDEFILWDQTIEPVAPTHSPTINMEGGQIIFRNTWEGGRGSRYLLFHGVPEGDNHGHPDLLSFIVEAEDAYLIADAGYGRDGFSDDKRNSWYTTPEAHNVVEVNGMPSWAAIPSNDTPPTPYFIDSGFFGFAEKRLERFLRNEDASQRRSVAFIGEDYWVVTDLLTADESKTYTAYLHGRGRYSRFGHHANWQTFDDNYGQAAELDAYLLPSNANFTDERSYISLFKDGRRTSYVEMAVEAQNVALMQVLVPGLPDDPSPAVADLSTDEFTAAKVSRNDATDIFLAQTTSATRSIEEVSTDGTFAWVRNVDEAVVNLAIREATAIGIGSEVHVATDIPATMAIDFSDPLRWRIHATAPTYCEITAQIRYPNASTVQYIIADGTEVPFEMSGDGDVVVDLAAVATAAERPLSVPKPDDIHLTNYPNPFTESTRLTFQADRAGDYRVEIFDVLGRRVAAFDHVCSTPGYYTVEWDGRDGTGRPTASGLYIGRVRHAASGASAARTITHIR